MNRPTFAPLVVIVTMPPNSTGRIERRNRERGKSDRVSSQDTGIAICHDGEAARGGVDGHVWGGQSADVSSSATGVALRLPATSEVLAAVGSVSVTPVASLVPVLLIWIV